MFDRDERVWISKGAKSGHPDVDSTGEAFRNSGAWATVQDRYRDIDGDIQVNTDEGISLGDGYQPRTFFYVHEDFLRTESDDDDGEKENNVDTESEPEVDGAWVAWSGGGTLVVFSEEIEALRYAVQHSGSAVRLAYGEELVI